MANTYVARASGIYIATFSLLAGAHALRAADRSAWADSADLILDTSPSGANVAGTVKGFPLLLRLTSAEFDFAQARGRGQDIRFADAAGKTLPYQIERWDSAGAKAEIWIKTDSIAGNRAGQSLRMYWGNPGATDSSNGGAVFSSGQVGVWHLGGSGNNARANSVAGGPAAVPANYGGGENATGMIGPADNLDGNDDYLDIGDGYQDFSGGFSFSVWAYPTAANKYARFFELGNGESADNIMLTRDSTSNTLRFDNYNPGATVSTVRAGGAIALNQWQLFGVTVSNGNVKLYKNGAVIASGALSNSISGNWRASNFLGHSNWSWDGYFQGLLDEAVIAKTAYSGNWMALCYQNQKAAQTLVTFRRVEACPPRVAAPADTTVAEGSILTLSASADCATSVMWTVLSGPAPRMLDPESRALTITIPRVNGDTVIRYRFTAVYADSSPHRDVAVHVREAMPEPAFYFPPSLTWNGLDTTLIAPVITNMASLRAAKDTVLHWAWSISGLAVDTQSTRGALVLKGPAPEGTLKVGLCLSNNGPATCKSALVTISNGSGSPLSLRLQSERSASALRLPACDVTGRLRVVGSQPRAGTPVYFRRPGN